MLKKRGKKWLAGILVAAMIGGSFFGPVSVRATETVGQNTVQSTETETSTPAVSAETETSTQTMVTETKTSTQTVSTETEASTQAKSTEIVLPDTESESQAVIANETEQKTTEAVEQSATEAADHKLSAEPANKVSAEDTNGQFQYLSDLPWDSVVTFEGNGPAIDKSYYQGELQAGEVRPLNIFGTEYEKGLGMHSKISVTYQLGGRYTRLTAAVGPDNSCNTSANMGRMGLKVLLDNNEVVYKVMDIRDPDSKFNLDLDLTGVQSLTFTGTPEGQTWSDSMCIADAKLYEDTSPQEGTGEFQSFDLSLPADSPLAGIGILDGKTVYVTVPENMDRTNLAAVFTTNTPDCKVTVNGVEQQSGVTKNDFSAPVKYVVENETGKKEFTVKVGTWQDIPGNFYDGDAKGKPERPYVRDYTKTMTMKMFLASPDGNGGSKVRLTFDEALDLIKQLDNVTRGIPKIIYLVGWQFNGHDDKYPSWAQVNEELKGKNCGDLTAKECLIRLMNEAYKYNTTVSFHINSTDAYTDSPLWQEYIDNDLISKKGGNLMAVGNYYGKTAYQVNYKNEWESGYYKKRVDQLLADFPIKKAGTIHSDAFFCRSSDQSSLAEEQEARRKMIRYWRDNGVDLTSEFLYSSNGSSESNSNGTGTGIIGLIPMFWHFWQSDNLYMTRPASLATGGDADNDAANKGLLFGRSMFGETLLTRDGVVGPVPGWDQNFINEFCVSTLQWAYMNQFDRLEMTGSGNSRVVRYSGGLESSLADYSVRKNGNLIRQGDDVFIPAQWKQHEVIAYSKNGYTSKEWTMPEGWENVNKVDIFSVSKNGLTPLTEEMEVTGGKITLSLTAGQMVSIVPTGSIQITAPSKFNLLKPADQETNVDPSNGGFTWESSKNAVSYKVSVAESSDMTKNLQEKTVTGNSAAFSEFQLVQNKAYYWQVTAVAATQETTLSSGSPARFTTILSGIPIRPANLSVCRYRNDLVKLDWDTSDLPYTYHVMRRMSGEKEFTEIGTTTDNSYQDTIAARTKGQTWEYMIRVVGSSGKNADSLITLLDQDVYVSDLTWTEANQANPNTYWGRITKDANLGNPATGENGPIRMGGITFEKGISMHAVSDVSYDIEGKYETFRAVAGTDDVNVELHKPTNVILSVFGDDKLLYESEIFTAANSHKAIVVDIKGVQKLTLKVRSGNGNVDSAWGVWGAARMTPVTQSDTAQLENLIAHVKSLKQEDYVPAGWTVLQNELSQAEELLLDQNVLQVNIDEQVAHLDAAIKGLQMIVRSDKSKLQLLYDKCSGLEQKNYTPSTWNTFAEARSQAADVLQNQSATQEVVNASWDTLFNALTSLRVSVNKELLAQTIELGKNANSSGCTPESIKKLADALSIGNELMGREDAAEEDVDNAVKAIMNAIRSLTFKADKAALDQAIAGARQLTEENYTSSTWSKLMETLDLAQTVVQNQNASQQEVAKAYQDLISAMRNLQNRPNTENLRKVIEVADEMIKNKTGYDRSSLAKLTAVLKQAKKMLAKEDESQQKVDEMRDKLIKRIKDTRPNPVTIQPQTVVQYQAAAPAGTTFATAAPFNSRPVSVNGEITNGAGTAGDQTVTDTTGTTPQKITDEKVPLAAADDKESTSTSKKPATVTASAKTTGMNLFGIVIALICLSIIGIGTVAWKKQWFKK